MIIKIIYDQNVNTLPVGFVTGVTDAVEYLEMEFTNPVTITIDVGYGEVDGQSLGSGPLGESQWSVEEPESYSAVVSALQAENAPGASTLPLTSPFPSGQLYISPAEAAALGLPLTYALPTGGGTSIDGYVGFSSVPGTFSYANDTVPAADEFYFIGVVEHEITEDMGRISLLDNFDGYSIADLFRYSSSSVRDLITGTSSHNSTAYFSIDDGVTNLGSWNNVPNNGDLADWYPEGPASGGNDAFNDYSNPGVINIVSPADITLMQALGWTIAVIITSAYNVSSGMIVAGDTVVGGGTMVVLSGGVADDTTVSAGGLLIIASGGTASASVVASGGTEFVSAGGTANDTTLVAGGIEVVSAGGSASGIMLSAGGTAEIQSGAAATVFGPIVFVGTGATVQIGDTANSVLSGLTLSGLAPFDAIDLTDVSFVLGATAQIVGGSALLVSVGGAAYDIGVAGAIVGGDLFEVVSDGSGGTLVDMPDISSGQSASVTAGEISSGYIVDSGGTLFVESGGVASGTVISGGSEVVSVGGKDVAAQILGGTQFVYGLVSGGTNFGGMQLIESNGSASGMVLSGGSEIVSAHAIDVIATIFSGTQLDCGLTSGATIVGGALIVESAGTAQATTISGGSEVVSAGAKDLLAQILGGAQDVYGTASGATVYNGGGQSFNGGGGNRSATRGSRRAAGVIARHSDGESSIRFQPVDDCPSHRTS